MSGFGDLPVIVRDEGRGREFALRERNAGERERIGRMGMGRCRSEPPAAGHRRDQGKNLAGHPGLTALPCVASSDFGTGAAARRKPVNDGNPPGRNKTGTAAQYTYRPRFDRGVVAPRRLPGGQNGQAWVVRGRPPRERSSPLTLAAFLRIPRGGSLSRTRPRARGLRPGNRSGPRHSPRRGAAHPGRALVRSPRAHRGDSPRRLRPRHKGQRGDARGRAQDGSRRDRRGGPRDKRETMDKAPA